MAGVRSPGTASPIAREEWHSDVVADLRLGGEGSPSRERDVVSSPFAEASLQPPLEETVIVTPSRVYHGLTRPGGHR
jgi:hypothetical protein